MKTLAEINAKFGNLHLLVNNAGIKTLRQASQVDARGWDAAVAVNFTGIYNGTSAVIPHMLAHKEGSHIVTTSSMGGILPGVNAGVYTATKFAACGLMEALRVELMGTNIGTSVFMPGGVSTDNIASEAGTESLMMDPLEAGERVLNGVKNNDLFIFTHPEFKPGMKERFDAILASEPQDGFPEARAKAADTRAHFAALCAGNHPSQPAAQELPQLSVEGLAAGARVRAGLRVLVLFPGEQLALAGDAPFVAGETAIGRDDAMAGHQHRDAIGGAGPGHGTRAGGRLEPSRQLAIGDGFARLKARQCVPYTPLEGGAADIQRQAGIAARGVDLRHHARHPGIQCVIGRRERGVGKTRAQHLQQRLACAEFHHADAAVGGGHQDRAETGPGGGIADRFIRSAGTQCGGRHSQRAAVAIGRGTGRVAGIVDGVGHRARAGKPAVRNPVRAGPWHSAWAKAPSRP